MSDTVKLVECTECEGKGWYFEHIGGGDVRQSWCEKCEGWGLTREYVDGVLTDLGYEKVEEKEKGGLNA